MDSNVFRLADFGKTKSAILEQLGFSADALAEPDTVKLPEIQYGEETIGTLDEDCKQVFFAFIISRDQQRDLERHHMAAMFSNMGQRMRQTSGDDPLASLMEGTKGPQEYAFADDDEAKVFFGVKMATDALHGLFWAMVSGRFNCSHWSLGIRKNFRVVKCERRW